MQIETLAVKRDTNNAIKRQNTDSSADKRVLVVEIHESVLSFFYFLSETL